MMNKQSAKLYYLTYGPSDEDWGLVVTTAGYQSIQPHAAYPPSKHPERYNFRLQNGRVLNEYQFVYIMKGKGWFSSQHIRNRSVKAGDLLILFPGEWHNYYPDGETGWDEYWVGFKSPNMEMLVGKGFFSPENAVLEIGISTTLVSLYEDLLQNIAHEKAGFQIMLAGILQHMTSLVYFKCKNLSFGNQYIIEKLTEARLLMKENVESPVSPEEIAARLGLGYSWFRKMFKDYTGISPAQYQIQLRLIRAKELLADTSLNISEIAYQLHFENGGQFSTFFKKREGVTPSDYRRGFCHK